MTDIGPGDIVICVDAIASGPGRKTTLVEGSRYVVEQIFPSGMTPHGPCTALTLRGIRNPKHVRYAREAGYDIQRFRPLRKSDSEIFREMIKLPEKIVA